MVSIILGSQFGDEGKGKITDYFAQEANLVCRAAGGHNAGHTIVTKAGDKFAFHLLPSGLISPKCLNLIGAGTVVNIPQFFNELEELESKGVQDVRSRVWISDRAQVCFQLHSVVDGLEEGALGKKKVGTTGKGIGPCYADKAARRGVRVGEIMNEQLFESKLRALASGYEQRFGKLNYDVDVEIDAFKKYRSLLRPFVIDQIPFIKKHAGEKTVIEGSQALMLDIDYGTYPYVTSSSTGIAGAIGGLCINPTSIKNIIGVVKSYTTRVGAGPMPTEQFNEDGDKLQTVGREVGVTTGRKRRCGWLDCVMLRYSCACNHYTALNLTKLDVLDDFDEIKVAVKYAIDGEVLESFPASPELLDKVTVQYATLPGWKTSTEGMKSWDNLPENAKKYVSFVEEQLGGVPIKWIGTGAAREDMIYR